MSGNRSVYAIGSEWRRWDLHVHTPASFVGVHYGVGGADPWDAFVDGLEKLPTDIKVIGICDYWSIDGYRKVLEYSRNGRLKNLDLILPGVELRLRVFAGTTALQKINMHVIFSSELDADTIQTEFVNRLRCGCIVEPAPSGEMLSGCITKEHIETIGRAIIESTPEEKRSSESAFEVGFANTCVNDEDVYGILKESFYLGDGTNSKRFITAIGRAEWDDMRWDGGGAGDKKTIANRADFILCASENPESVLRDREKLKDEGVNHQILHCSDAHYGLGSPERTRLGHCFTWIKADPTFDGLRQAVFDYEDRVRIASTSPLQEHPRQYFSKIALPGTTALRDPETGREVKFEPAELPLNPYLVTVIGGRGSGKSLLLRALASCCLSSGVEPASDSDANQSFSDQCNLSLVLHKAPADEQQMSNKEPGHVDYLYVSQGSVNESVASPRALSRSLYRLLGVEDTAVGIGEDLKALSILAEMEELRQKKHVRSQAGQDVDARDYYVKQKNDAEARLQSLQTLKTQELVSELTAKRKEVHDLDSVVEQLQTLATKTTQFGQEVKKEIQDVSLIFAPPSAVPDLGFGELKGFLSVWENACRKKSDTLHERITEVENNFATAGIAADPQEALERIRQHQEKVQESNTALAELDKAGTRMGELWTRLSELADSLLSDVDGRREGIVTAWQGLKNGRQGWDEEQKQLVTRLLKGIQVQGTVEFPISDFYSAVSGALNKGKFRKTGELSQEDRIRKSLQVNDVRSYSELLKNTARIQLPDSDERVTLSEFVSRSDYFNEGGIELFLKCLFMSEQRSKYLSVIPTVQYEGKSLGALSIGQRGTVYVVIKLATSAFGVPLVYDQPEDDLDQKFISEELVLLFRGIKKYRQIIIVTHNANLVVNTDAEQVIVASNTAVGKSESISYYSGSIENTGSSDNSSRRGIREQACAILEGGKEAFRQRERRYGLSTAK